jgi:hypothetical protein
MNPKYYVSNHFFQLTLYLMLGFVVIAFLIGIFLSKEQETSFLRLLQKISVGGMSISAVVALCYWTVWAEWDSMYSILLFLPLYFGFVSGGFLSAAQWAEKRKHIKKTEQQIKNEVGKIRKSYRQSLVYIGLCVCVLYMLMIFGRITESIAVTYISNALMLSPVYCFSPHILLLLIMSKESDGGRKRPRTLLS